MIKAIFGFAAAAIKDAKIFEVHLTYAPASSTETIIKVKTKA